MLSFPQVILKDNVQNIPECGFKVLNSRHLNHFSSSVVTHFIHLKNVCINILETRDALRI